MTIEANTAKLCASWDTLILSGQMTVADFERMVPSTVTGILSFGMCGGLAPGLPVGGVVLCSELITDQGIYYPDLIWNNKLSQTLDIAPSIYYSTGQFNLADTPAQRAALYQKYNAVAIDDESGPMAEFAGSRKIPFAVLRVVSDAWDDTVPLAARNALNPDGSSNVGSIISWLEAHPDQAAGQVWDLAGIALDYNNAANVLLRVGRQVGQFFQFGV